MVESFGGRGGGGGRDGGKKPNNDGFGSNWNMDTIFSMKDISPQTQAHLTRVYTALFSASGVCAGGMYLNSTFLI